MLDFHSNQRGNPLFLESGHCPVSPQTDSDIHLWKNPDISHSHLSRFVKSLFLTFGHGQSRTNRLEKSKFSRSGHVAFATNRFASPFFLNFGHGKFPPQQIWKFTSSYILTPSIFPHTELEFHFSWNPDMSHFPWVRSGNLIVLQCVTVCSSVLGVPSIEKNPSESVLSKNFWMSLLILNFLQFWKSQRVEVQRFANPWLNSDSTFNQDHLVFGFWFVMPTHS